MELRLKLVMAHARYRGWVVDRKQVSQVTARVAVGRGDLEAAIRADVERLSPGAIRALEASPAASQDQLRAIAAGDVIDSRAAR